MSAKDRLIEDTITKGKLFVFEGIDNVGKSTIIAELSKRLKERNIAFSTYSFPGKESGTLGALVYHMHHNQDAYFNKPIDALSLQMLHIAAHIDTIQNRIIPDLRAGKTVLLDRFYWSTYAYGVANGIKKSVLKDIILPEKKALRKTTVGHYFIIKRKNIIDDYSSNFSEIVSKAYMEISEEAQKSGQLTIVDNDYDILSSVEKILEIILNYSLETINFQEKNCLSDSPVNESLKKSMTFFIKSPGPKATAIYDTYWNFATKRQDVFFNRFYNERFPWTDDTVLQKYKFTNVYRASDRVSQYLINKVIYSNMHYSSEDLFFRIILFKLFNKIETWEYLQNKLGDINYKSYRYELYDKVLTEALAEKRTIYSAAYIMPSGQSAFGYDRKHKNNLRLLEKMMLDHLPQQIAKLKNMEQLYKLLLSYPTLGKFLAFQYCIDINYSELCDFSEMSFVVSGPGASNGIRKCFQNTHGYSDEDIIRYVTECQDKEFSRLGLNFQSLWGRPLQLIDCQNLFCETDKYARVAFPGSQGDSKRKRIKQLFVEHSGGIDYFYPPKWNINQYIKRG